MSKNIFNVLATNDDSDDERQVVNKRSEPKQDAKKDSKKEARAKDSQLREKFGDKVEKDARPAKSGPKPKDDYAPNEKRPYERHSGTGRPAFKKNDFKKGGHGKGNVGGQDEEKVEKENGEVENQEEEAKVNIVKLPEEEIVTVDDYLSNTGMTFGLKADHHAVKNKDPKAFEDATTKAIVSKRTLQNEDNKKPAKAQEKKQVNKNFVEIDITGPRKRDNKQNSKKGYVKYDKNEFPSLD